MVSDCILKNLTYIMWKNHAKVFRPKFALTQYAYPLNVIHHSWVNIGIYRRHDKTQFFKLNPIFMILYTIVFVRKFTFCLMCCIKRILWDFWWDRQRKPALYRDFYYIGLDKIMISTLACYKLSSIELEMYQ